MSPYFIYVIFNSYAQVCLHISISLFDYQLGQRSLLPVQSHTVNFVFCILVGIGYCHLCSFFEFLKFVQIFFV